MALNATFNIISVISWHVLIYNDIYINGQLLILFDDHCVLIETIYIVNYSIVDIAYTVFSLRTRKIMRIQSVPIATNVVISNPAHGEVYSIQHYVIQLVSELRQVGGFLRVLRFPPTIKLTATICLKHDDPQEVILKYVPWQYINTIEIITTLQIIF
jgi:hypothetical protein